MPRKDPEEFKKYQREQMRQRRAQAKLNKTAGDNLPLATAGTPTAAIPGKSSLKPNKPAPASKKPSAKMSQNVPATKQEYQVDWEKRRKESAIDRPQIINMLARDHHFADVPPGEYWSRFPRQAGLPCLIDTNYACCYELNFADLIAALERDGFRQPGARYCDFDPLTCNYSRLLTLFDLAGAK